ERSRPASRGHKRPMWRHSVNSCRPVRRRPPMQHAERRRHPMSYANTALLHTMARIRAMQNRDERGASMAEYGLLLALIAVVAIGALTSVGGNVKTKFQAVADNLK